MRYKGVNWYRYMSTYGVLPLHGGFKRVRTEGISPSSQEIPPI